jgi:hypothetical protein
MGQIYTNDINFTKFIPMKKKSDAPDTLLAFMQDVGIPSDLHSDDAKELTQGRMGEITRKAWIKTSQSEPYSPWQVRAELCNRELKKAVRYTMEKNKGSKTPLGLLHLIPLRDTQLHRSSLVHAARKNSL